MNRTVISALYSPYIPPWNDLNRTKKIKEAVMFAGRNGAHAITLRMPGKTQDLLSKRSKPMEPIRKRMNQALREFNLQHLPLILTLEATRPGNQLHLHGVIITRGCSLKQIQIAMRRAVGYIDGHSGSRQFFARDVTNAGGWHNYLVKDRAHTLRLLNLSMPTELWFVSQSMTRVVREEYEAIRLGRRKSANTGRPPESEVV